jgi:hypothetical protein
MLRELLPETCSTPALGSTTASATKSFTGSELCALGSDDVDCSYTF